MVDGEASPEPEDPVIRELLTFFDAAAASCTEDERSMFARQLAQLLDLQQHHAAATLLRRHADVDFDTADEPPQ